MRSVVEVQEQLKDLLKQNLKVELIVKGGRVVQGEGKKVSFKLMLENIQVGSCIQGGKVVLR